MPLSSYADDNAAEIWGVGDKLGSIEKGKWADLIVMSGDPLDSESTVKKVYVKGVEIELTNKQTGCMRSIWGGLIRL
jgi:imidazolonepropionase-like amidohydrolase